MLPSFLFASLQKTDSEVEREADAKEADAKKRGSRSLTYSWSQEFVRWSKMTKEQQTLKIKRRELNKKAP